MRTLKGAERYAELRKNECDHKCVGEHMMLRLQKLMKKSKSLKWLKCVAVQSSLQTVLSKMGLDMPMPYTLEIDNEAARIWIRGSSGKSKLKHIDCALFPFSVFSFRFIFWTRGFVWQSRILMFP